MPADRVHTASSRGRSGTSPEAKRASKWSLVRAKARAGTSILDVKLFKQVGESLGYNCVIETGVGLRVSGRDGPKKSKLAGNAATANNAGGAATPATELALYDLITHINETDVTGVKTMGEVKKVLDRHRPNLEFTVQRKQAGFQFSAAAGRNVPSPPQTRPDAANKAAVGSTASQRAPAPPPAPLLTLYTSSMSGNVSHKTAGDELRQLLTGLRLPFQEVDLSSTPQLRPRLASALQHTGSANIPLPKLVLEHGGGGGGGGGKAFSLGGTPHQVARLECLGGLSDIQEMVDEGTFLPRLERAAPAAPAAAAPARAAAGKAQSRGGWSVAREAYHSAAGAGLALVEVTLFKPAGVPLGYSVTIDSGGLRVSGKVKGVGTGGDGGERSGEGGGDTLEMYDLIVGINGKGVTDIKSVKQVKIIMDKNRPHLVLSVMRKKAGYQFNSVKNVFMTEQEAKETAAADEGRALVEFTSESQVCVMVPPTAPGALGLTTSLCPLGLRVTGFTNDGVGACAVVSSAASPARGKPARRFSVGRGGKASLGSSPTAEAGMQKGQIVCSLDGESIANKTMGELDILVRKKLQPMSNGESVKLKLGLLTGSVMETKQDKFNSDAHLQTQVENDLKKLRRGSTVAI